MSVLIYKLSRSLMVPNAHFQDLLRLCGIDRSQICEILILNMWCFVPQVMEVYRKIQAARAKKKSPSKKEMELAKKALKEREIIVRQLESAMPYGQ